MARTITKYSLLSLLILSLNSFIMADSWLGTFWRVLVGTRESGRGSSLQQEASNYIDHLLATNTQPPRIRRTIQEKKHSFIMRTIIHIEHDEHLTYSEKIQKVQQKAHEWVLQLIAEQAKQFADQHTQRIHRNPPINPAYLNHQSDRDVANNATQEILREAQQKAESSRYGSLKNHIGEPLGEKVGFFVEREFGVFDRPAPSETAHYSSTPRPSGPPLETARPAPPAPLYPDLRPSSHEIYEVYPAFENDERYQDFTVRKQHGKLFQDAHCIVCLEEYKEIGKRVNLFCGHTICPTCLYQWLYRENKRTCPHCRAEIYTREFPQPVLNPDVN